MKKILTVFVAVAVVATTFFLFEETVPIRHVETPIREMVFFGDSLTKGYGIKSEQETFSYKVAKSFSLPLRNFGVNGDTTASALKRISQVSPLNEGALIVVTLGGNDILHRKDLAETVSNLRKIFKYFQNKGCAVAFTEVLTPMPFVSRRRDAYRELCHEEAVLYIPNILDGIILKQELMHDKIHPNAAGAAIIADKIVSQLQDAGFKTP